MRLNRQLHRFLFVPAIMPLLALAPLDSSRDAEPAAAAVATCDGREATIVGTAGDDVLVGTSGADVIVGRGGNDIIRGKGGADVICGGAGRDSITGGKGRDRIFGGGGRDTVSGGAGADKIFGDAGRDTLSGGGGPDRIVGGAGADTLTGGGRSDTLLGKGGDDDLDGGVGFDTCDGGSGFNTMRCDDYLGAGFVVPIQDFEFVDGTITVPVGSNVLWHNTQGLHTTESTTDLWDSGDLDVDDTFGVTFDEPGAYSYICYYHPFMTGTITVEE